jgi:hypothetical protein
LKLLVNGNEADAGMFTVSIPSSPVGFKVGCAGARSNFYRGTIDDVRIWSVALDRSTIDSWRSKPVDGSHPNVETLGYWRRRGRPGRGEHGSLPGLTAGLALPTRGRRGSDLDDGCLSRARGHDVRPVAVLVDLYGGD